MATKNRKERLRSLVTEYIEFKKLGKLDLTSEETIRTWLNDLLSIFDWDVRDTSQILQEKILSKAEKDKLKEIGSQNIKPDYTFKLAKQKLTFLDAKDISVNIKKDVDAAFQIKSYGWSILAPCAFISNFEEFAIYDCTYIPAYDQDPKLGRIYLTVDEYVDKFDLLENHLLKDNIYKGKLNELYSATLKDNPLINKITPDVIFAEQLSKFRFLLASDILDKNKDFIDGNAANLSYIVQVIINRIIFIRVCEANKIEEDGLLISFRDKGFWKSFKKSSYFNFYKHYDGPLFERINSIHQIEISNNVFDKLLDYLYYPSPYRFDVIPPKLLSDIYEIFLSKKLLIVKNKLNEEIKSEYLKTKGAVSTPQFIVREIIRRTINRGNILKEGIDNLLSIKVLDLACGSGAFIIEVYDYLEDVFKKLYSSSKNPKYKKYFVSLDSNLIINLLGKKIIIENCIFGVDIDPEAVEVAKMSLSLKIVDESENILSYNEIGIFGNKILDGVGNNIRCGNSLVDSEILNMYPELANDENEIIKTNIFDWKEEKVFKNIFNLKKGFDYIISNPPYVEVKNYNIDLPYMHLYIKEKYSSARNGKIDLAIPFIEKSISLLNNKGRLGFIIQKRFFKTTYGKTIRKIITDLKLISSIIDFETTSIFKDRITYVALLFLDKSSSNNFHYKLFKSGIETIASELRGASLPEIDNSNTKLLSKRY